MSPLRSRPAVVLAVVLALAASAQAVILAFRAGAPIVVLVALAIAGTLVVLTRFPTPPPAARAPSVGGALLCFALSLVTAGHLVRLLGLELVVHPGFEAVGAAGWFLFGALLLAPALRHRRAP